MLEIALTLFLVTNPIGNSPAILALVKNFSFEKQKKILLRETLFALIIALFFQYFGEIFLGALHIERYATTLTGGVILLLVSLGMMFPSHEADNGQQNQQEPYIVPIATPLLSGSGLLSTIMLYAAREGNQLLISSAILLAWVGVTVVMYAAPYLQKYLGLRGLLALEQFMGMVLALISVEMLVKGASLFIKTLTAI